MPDSIHNRQLSPENEGGELGSTFFDGQVLTITQNSKKDLNSNREFLEQVKEETDSEIKRLQLLNRDLTSEENEKLGILQQGLKTLSEWFKL